jgi:hypothetical protein
MATKAATPMPNTAAPYGATMDTSADADGYVRGPCVQEHRSEDGETNQAPEVAFQRRIVERQARKAAIEWGRVR